jgi:hypothetical protein
VLTGRPEVLLHSNFIFALFRFPDVHFCSGVDVKPFEEHVPGDQGTFRGNIVWSSTVIVSVADHLAEIGNALLVSDVRLVSGRSPFYVSTLRRAL